VRRPPPLCHRPGDGIDPGVRLLYSIGPGDVVHVDGKQLVSPKAMLNYALGDERPTYSWSEPERAWVLVDIVRARA
jgi:hypothetical protein